MGTATFIMSCTGWYGYDRVWYRHRDYTGPRTEPVKAVAGELGPLPATGQTVIGLPVLSSKSAGRSPYPPTLLILQRSRTECLVYGLSGGP